MSSTWTRSLRSQLLAWVLAPVACAVAFNGCLAWHSAQQTATAGQDALLVGAARIIAEQLRYDDGSFDGHVPPAALELFQGQRQDRVYHRSTTQDGRILFGYPELPLPTAALQPEQPLLYDSSTRGEPVRVVAFLQPVVGGPEAEPVVVQVAQTRRAHAELARTLWLHAVWQQLGLLLLMTGLIVLGLRRALAPVLRLRDGVLARDATTLAPLDDSAVPTELAPLVAAMNDYTRRLVVYTESQQVFVQNAAHQLRTPFTLLQTQISFAQRASDEATRRESLAAIRRTVQQSVRLVHQLLALSAAQAQAHAERPARATALHEVAQQVLEALSALAESKGIDLGLEEALPQAHVNTNPVALREMLMNLVDNAIRYTQPGGMVTIHITQSGGCVVLRVEDNGPGIPPQQLQAVFERFYRLHNGESDGCGLGLPVVRELATHIGARVSLRAAPVGRGLLAEVLLPPGALVPPPCATAKQDDALTTP